MVTAYTLQGTRSVQTPEPVDYVSPGYNSPDGLIHKHTQLLYSKDRMCKIMSHVTHGAILPIAVLQICNIVS